MKKFISKITSALICTGILLSTSLPAAAETVTVDPDYPIHGNKCGTLYIDPEIDRDVYVKITQCTPDGDYVYYNTTIPAAGEATGDNIYSFLLEGKDDVSYDIVIGVKKYKSSGDPQLYTYEFKIKDTDDIVDDIVSGYTFYFELVGGSEFNTPMLMERDSLPKDENNIIRENHQVYFPLADHILGDVNFDNKIDLHDAIEIAKYLLNNDYFNQEQLIAGDYNESGKVDIYDAIAIAKMLIGK